MTSVWLRARREMRARWRAWLAIALMIGVAGGVVMAAAAGARRSDSAVARFLSYTKASDADVEADPSTYREISSLPEVDSAFGAAFLLMGRSRRGGAAASFGLNTIAFTDASLTQATHPLITRGRLLNLDDPGEAMINETALRQGHVKVGDRLTFYGYTFDQLATALRGSDEPAKGPSVTVTVVGVLRFATDLSTSHPPSNVIYTGNATIVMTPALYGQVSSKIANFASLAIRLKRGAADFPLFQRDLKRITHGQGVAHQGSDDLQAGLEAQRATHTEALALWLFTGLAGAAGLLVIGQSISRQIFLGSGDNPTLLALGMGRGQLAVVALIEVGIAAVAGAANAVSVAILLSPLTPIGLAREAEVDIGFHLDSTVVLIGAAACIVLMVARAVEPAWRAGKNAAAKVIGRKSQAADVLARAGMPPTSVAGVRMALDPGRGRTAVPVRTALGGSVIAIAVLITALAFGTSVSTLGSSPRAQGWAWDFAVGNPHSDDATARAIPLLRKNADVAGFSALAFAGATLDGRTQINALGVDEVVGDVTPPVLEGRSPAAPNEIALGSKVLRDLGKKVGDTVSVRGSDPAKQALQMKIVGRALITPIIVNGQITVGSGAVVQLTTLKSITPPISTDEGAVNVFLLKLVAGANKTAAAAALQKDFPGTVLTPYAPSEIENLRRIDTLPYVLAGLLALLAIATIAHALITSVRRRRRDLAVLKTLGFVRAQVRATVAWQASTLTALASAVGLVAGVVGGRWLWIFYAGRLGVRPQPDIPVLVLIIMVPVALVLANVVAAVPARSAARTQPALVLRAE